MNTFSILITILLNLLLIKSIQNEINFAIPSNNTRFDYLKSPNALADMAQLLYDLRHYEQALEYCGKALNKDPDNTLAIKIKSKANECIKRNFWFRLRYCPSILPNILF